jgi:hypothetical protein
MANKQREAVYLATMAVLADHGINFDDGQAGGVEAVVTKELRRDIIQVVTTSLLAGETEMSAEGRAKYTDEKSMKGYVNGLVSNWFRKDLRFNGNVKHEIKAPGSRAGSGDEVLKALKTLREVKADDAEAVVLIDAKIAERKAEIGTKKTATITDEMLALVPAELRAKLGL